MKKPKILIFLGLAALLSACAIQPYRAEIDTFDGLIKINPKDVRECEAYAKSNAIMWIGFERFVEHKIEIKVTAKSTCINTIWSASP